MMVHGGKLYWMKNEHDDRKTRGIVVVLGWTSIRETHLKSHVDFYDSIGWDSLVCYADFLNILHPQKAINLAFSVLNELLRELRIRLCPVVFAAFSGCLKACTYKVFQIIEGLCEGRLNKCFDAVSTVAHCGCKFYVLFPWMSEVEAAMRRFPCCKICLKHR